MSHIHRKTVKHYREPGSVHELTFSCYQRLPLLTCDDRREMLSRSIETACTRHSFRLSAFVFMPEHVHLLVLPEGPSFIPDLLKAIKQPYSFRVKQRLAIEGDPLLARLTIRERPGKFVFRFWQEGGGYDRNLITSRSVPAALDYIHMNPVRRRLAEKATAWRWSSAAFYIDPNYRIDPALPRIQPLPPETWE